MAVAYRSSTSANKVASSGQNLVLNVPAGTVDGDVMVAYVLTATGTTAATQASWTALDNQTGGPTAASFYRIASSEPASYTFTVVDAQSSNGLIVTYSGTHATTPINQHSAWNRLTSTANATANTVTPSVDNCMILYLAGAGTSTAITPPAGYTERVDFVVASTANVELAELLQTSAAATGNKTGTASGSTNTQGSLIALAPAAGGSAPANTVAPVASGTATVGSTVSVTNGTWTDNGSPTFTYQWQRDLLGNASYSNIAAATSNTYVLTLLDDSCNVRCVVTDTDSNGATAANSNSILDLTDRAVPAINATQHGRAVHRSTVR